MILAPKLSLVIPAYNEATRLPRFLADVRPYLDAEYPGDYEVVVVDDGSRDGTSWELGAIADSWDELRLMRHSVNQGKGAAVRTGVLAAVGRTILFADADGATPITEEWRLSAALARGADVAIGSRAVSGPGVHRERTRKRAAAGNVFAWIARQVLGLAIRDTQCGFKMFERDAARELFTLTRETGYLFDLEVLAVAHRMGLRVDEVAVSWADQPGSKVSLARDGWKMARGLWTVRANVAGLKIAERTALRRAA